MPNLVLGGGGVTAAAYDIDNSLRFNVADSAYLSRVPAVDGNRKTWTFSCWFKKSGITGDMRLLTTNDSSTYVGFKYSTNEDVLRIDAAGVYNYTTAVYRDPSAWYHVVACLDTTQGIGANRSRAWINGTEVTWANPGDNQTLNVDSDFNYTSKTMSVGSKLGVSELDGYIAECYFLDGTGVTDASDFGELNATTNQWIPKDASDLTFGTNGFYQKYGSTELANSFEDSSNHSIHIVTAVGNAHTDTSVKKIGTASLQVDGTGDWLTIPASYDWNFGTGDFTVEAWLYVSSANTYAFGQYSEGGAFAVNQGSGTEANWYRDGGSNLNFGSGSAPSADTWTHVAIVRSSSVTTYYKDGVATGTSQADTHDYDAEGEIYYVGSVNTNPSHPPIVGYIDEFRISNTARYVGRFTPSTTEFTADQYTKLLLHMDGSDSGTTFTDSSWTGELSGGNHPITANGDVTNTRAVRKIGDSSIIFDGTGDYLSIADSADFNFGTGDFTVEGWMNITNMDSPGHTESSTLLGQGTAWYTAAGWRLAVWDMGGVPKSAAGWYNGSSYDISLAGSTTMTVGGWHHYAVVRSGSGADNVTLYTDGVVEDTDTFTGSIDLNAVNVGYTNYNSTDRYLLGYTDEIRISNSARYTSAFTPSTTAFTADANTKLLIHSDWTGGLGADSSGNYNNFAATNLVATDQMLDSPTNNFCTFNPLNGQAAILAVLEEGNLRVGTGAGSGASGYNLFSTQAVSSGKWYYEYRDTSPVTRNSGIGWCDVNMDLLGSGSGALDVVGAVWYNNIMYQLGSSAAIGATLDTNTIAGVALDADAGKVWFSHDGTWWDSQDPAAGTNAKFTAGTNPTTWMPIFHGGNDGEGTVNYGQDSSFAGAVTAQGNQDDNDKGDFYYDVPAGFLALCTDNLSEDLDITLPGKNFNTVIYDDGAGAKTGIGFQPDFVWVKSRGNTYDHKLTDAVRGVTKAIVSNDTSVETTDSTGLTAFGADGFTVGADTDYSDTTGLGMIAWSWLAGGAPTVDNEEAAGAVPDLGSVMINGVASTAALAGAQPLIRGSANTEAGFSICHYEGDGTSSNSFAHLLSVAPKMVICKNLSAVYDWPVAWQATTDQSTAYLNNDAASFTGTNQWNGLVPTPSLVNIGASSETNSRPGQGDKIIAYCFHSVEGYSKVGSYTGNGNADGPFIYTGFKPAMVIFKNASSASNNWDILDNKRDTYNPVDDWLYVSGTSIGGRGTALVDFTSNGFKLRIDIDEFNKSGDTLLYLAFAESPFKYSNAR